MNVIQKITINGNDNDNGTSVFYQKNIEKLKPHFMSQKLYKVDELELYQRVALAPRERKNLSWNSMKIIDQGMHII